MDKGKGCGGCVGIFMMLLVLGMLIKYWYIILAVALIVVAVVIYQAQQKKQTADEQAAAVAERTADDRRIAKLKTFKKMLDQTLISTVEYDHYKALILNADAALINQDHVLGTPTEPNGLTDTERIKRLYKFKQLLDDRAITVAEYQHYKEKLLNSDDQLNDWSDSQDPLEF